MASESQYQRIEVRPNNPDYGVKLVHVRSSYFGRQFLTNQGIWRYWLAWLIENDPDEVGWDVYLQRYRDEYLKVTGVIPGELGGFRDEDLFRYGSDSHYPTIFTKGNGLRFKLEMDFGFYRIGEFLNCSFMEWMKQDAGIALTQLENIKGFRIKDQAGADNALTDAEKKLKS